MTFATATIQGYVNWIGELQQTPKGRNVVNLLVSVPNKQQPEQSTTYQLSVWDNQAGSVLKYISPKQIITATGQLKVSSYVDKNGEYKNVCRLDFASILDYGVPKGIEEQQNPKASFVNIGDIAVKKKVAVKA